MKTKLIPGAVGALGLLWAHAAQASTVNLDDTDAITTTKYASELLSSAAGSVSTVDGKSYYHVTDGNEFSMTRTLQTDGGGDDIGVRFIFTNLVFVGTGNDASNLSVSNDRAVRRYGSDGEAGDSVTTWIVEDAARSDVLTISLGETVAISGDAPATVQLVVTGADSGTSLFPDVEPEENNVGPVAVLEVAGALEVSTTPMDQTASVEEDFMRFKAGDGVADNGLLASLGSFAVSANTTYLNPVDGTFVALGDLFTPGSGSGAAATGSMISLNGEFAFLKSVTLQDPDDETSNNDTVPRDFCDDVDTTELLMAATATTAAKVAKTPLTVDGNEKELCIELYDPDSDSEGEKASQIPAGDYSASLEFEPPATPGRDSAMPAGTKAAALGRQHRARRQQRGDSGHVQPGSLLPARRQQRGDFGHVQPGSPSPAYLRHEQQCPHGGLQLHAHPRVRHDGHLGQRCRGRAGRRRDHRAGHPERGVGFRERRTHRRYHRLRRCAASSGP